MRVTIERFDDVRTDGRTMLVLKSLSRLKIIIVISGDTTGLMEHLWITQTGMKTIPTLWITEKLVSLCMSAKMIPMVIQVTHGGTPTATLHWAYYARLLLKMGHSLLHHYLHDLQIFHVMRERVRSGSRVVRKTPGVMHSMASVMTL